MHADDPSHTKEQWPREITPEAAAKLRAHYLLLMRETAAPGGAPNGDDSSATDATVAAFVLPGD